MSGPSRAGGVGLTAALWLLVVAAVIVGAWLGAALYATWSALPGVPA